MGPIGLALPLALSVGGAIAVSLVRAIAPETAGSGIPHLKAVLHHLRPLRWARVLLVKFAGGVAASARGSRSAARGRPCRWVARSGRW